MAGVKLHWNAVAPPVAAVFRRLSAALVDSDCYLAGGTALALQIGHRRSADLDVFSPSLSNPEELATRLYAAMDGVEVTATAPRTVEVAIDGVPASFFGYPYPMLRPLVRVEPKLLPLASADDIAAMKLAAIASRGSRKDFIDLWTIVRRGRSLGECLDLFAEKFATRDLGHVLRSLTYFDEADGEPPLQLLDDIDWQWVKTDVSLAVEAYLRA
jgi:Nucleotidyl transferase AbiEii toxin, Type IV TA system